MNTRKRDRLLRYADQCDRWAAQARAEGRFRLAVIFREQAAWHRRAAQQLDLPEVA